MEGITENSIPNTKNELKRARVPYIKEKKQKTFETKADKKFKDKTQIFFDTRTKQNNQILNGQAYSNTNIPDSIDFNNSNHINAIGPLYYKDSFLADPWSNSQSRNLMQ